MWCFRCCKASVINVDDLGIDETLTPESLAITPAVQSMTTNLDRGLEGQQHCSRSRYNASRNLTPARRHKFFGYHTMPLESAVYGWLDDNQ
jgi:hypothetical protein